MVAPAFAHLSNPATLEIKEVSPGQFTVVLTLPLIDGRVLKARPVLPDICVIKGEPAVQSSGSAVIRTWEMECDPNDLVGAPIGVHGLLGTSLEILLTIETLDGRKHVQPLRPTQSFYAISPPPTFIQLARDAGGQGIRRILHRPELVLLFVVSVFLALRTRAFVAGIFAFAVAQGLGQWLAGQNWMTVSPFLPKTLTALTALLAALELVRRKPVLRPGWHRPLWIPMLFLGVLYGAAQPETVPTMGLSRVEQSMAFAFAAVGGLAGLALATLCAHELRSALGGLSEGARERCVFWAGYLSGVLGCALCLYQVSAPAFIGGVTPAVPAVTLVAAAVLGLWCRAQRGFKGAVAAIPAGALFGVGVALSFRGVTLPLTTLVVFGLLALLGASLLLPARRPAWAAFIAVAAAAGYHGVHAGHLLRDNTSLPVANAAGMGALVAFLFYACYRATRGAPDGRLALPVRVCGALTAALAVLWRLAEYREWFGGPIAAEAAMGFVRLPVLAVVLLLAAGLAWPRKRRFRPRAAAVTPVRHWVLIAAAFFVFPLGTLRVRNPFHVPRPPTAVEAQSIIDTLLTDTYLAFNLPDENAAFDQLARNLSEDLVADVYLDSRRRLTAGTRQGAEVTVRDVSVMSVAEASPNASGDNSFTYPCKWIVTARVKHWQHVHSRQNVYVGKLTIQVEEDHWKIARLNLESEERVVLSRQSS
ncbi:MAG: hypothetical protein ACYTAN_01290 [Planctomycetota bacterium]